jgi:adenosylcobinamide-phosphate synthase
VSVLVAAALDAGLAEPPAAVHPVVWTGRYLDAVARWVPAGPSARAVARGGLAWAAGALATLATAVAVERVAARLGPVGRGLVRGTALWPLLSARMLLDEVRGVDVAVSSDLGSGRATLSRIVSRDTAHLDAEQVRAAAIESLAENLSDAVVAPVVWYLLAGLPGAALHRYANTADACWGYRSPRWRYAGRVAARADDLLNLVPARLTAALLGGAPRREARRTTSPNAGWPMAALAVRLDLRLAKPGHYVLHPSGAPPGPGDVDRALRTVRTTLLAAAVAAVLADRLLHRPRGDRP